MISRSLLKCSDTSGNRTAYFLESRQDIAEFIKDAKPTSSIDLNRIPIKSWIVYYADDSGDSRYDFIETLSGHKNDLMMELIGIVKELEFIKSVEELSK